MEEGGFVKGKSYRRGWELGEGRGGGGVPLGAALRGRFRHHQHQRDYGLRRHGVVNEWPFCL